MKDLHEFVNRALSAGKTREEVRTALSLAGWHEDEIDKALSKYAAVDFPIPVPRRLHSGSAREAFAYLVTFTALYISAFSFCYLVAATIDIVILDPADSYRTSWSFDDLRWTAASLLVAFPLYFFLTTRNLRMSDRDPELRESPVRKWLIAATLFLSAVTVLITMIVFVSSLLGGELPIRFALKTITVLVVAFLIFGFYLWELRKGEAKK